MRTDCGVRTDGEALGCAQGTPGGVGLECKSADRCVAVGGVVYVLSEPVVLNKSAAAPMEVLSFPVLKRSVPAPTPVLRLPPVLLKSEYQPFAVFAMPVVRLKRAFCPSAVLNLG